MTHDHESSTEQHWPDEADFPSEAEWLDLPCPPISADFCARVMGRLDGDSDVDIEADAVFELPTSAFDVPEPSSDFVERTLARLRRESSPGWQRLLQQHAVPEPTPDFVDRVLAALRSEDTDLDAPALDAPALDAPAPAAPARATRRARGRVVARPVPAWRRRPALAAAAAAALLVAGFFVFGPHDRGAAVDRSFAVTAAHDFSPDRFGTALGRIGARGLPLHADDPLLTLTDVARRGSR